MLDRASSVQVVVTVATASEYTLSSNRTLTFSAGETESTGVVTLTARITLSTRMMRRPWWEGRPAVGWT